MATTAVRRCGRGRSTRGVRDGVGGKFVGLEYQLVFGLRGRQSHSAAIMYADDHIIAAAAHIVRDGYGYLDRLVRLGDRFRRLCCPAFGHGLFKRDLEVDADGVRLGSSQGLFHKSLIGLIIPLFDDQLHLDVAVVIDILLRDYRVGQILFRCGHGGPGLRVIHDCCDLKAGLAGGVVDVTRIAAADAFASGAWISGTIARDVSAVAAGGGTIPASRHRRR